MLNHFKYRELSFDYFEINKTKHAIVTRDDKNTILKDHDNLYFEKIKPNYKKWLKL